MLIDWFTVFAQILNFLVLVYLLKRFLYGRIIRAMDEREKTIALGLEEAQQKKDDAQQEMDRYIAKNKELDDHRQALLAGMKEEVEAHRKDLMNDARKQVETVRVAWYQSLERENRPFLMTCANGQASIPVRLLGAVSKICQTSIWNNTSFVSLWSVCAI